MTKAQSAYENAFWHTTTLPAICNECKQMINPGQKSLRLQFKRPRITQTLCEKCGREWEDDARDDLEVA